MLNILLTVLVLILFYSVILLFARIIERLREHRGKELDYFKINKTHSKLFMAFGVLFLGGLLYAFKALDYASLPESASNFGGRIDTLFFVTAVITGTVFVITHITLFSFVWLYRGRKNRSATFFAHSGTLEIIWTSIPALAMAVLVVMGLNVWFDIFPGGKSFPADQMQIEVTGKQFNWIVRYPGPDGKLGRRVISKEMITPDNELGIDWSDPNSHDDFFASEIHMVKNKPVFFQLSALDVLHSFYLPHFRLKMDCVPGIPTGFGFTPTKTNDETREELKKNPYWSSIDPETNEPRFKKFTYELACAELCGKSHYGMLTNVIVESQAEFDKWAASQKSHYSSIKDKLGVSTVNNIKEFKIEDLAKGIDKNAVYTTDGIQFSSGSSELNAKSKGTLDQLYYLLQKDSTLKITLSAHTDNTGNATSNLKISDARAKVCAQYLVSKGIDPARITTRGFGDTKPIADNSTEEGKQKNRRTEFDFN